MITKVMPKLSPIVKQPIRANLQKASTVGLLFLAGSSMSGLGVDHSTIDYIIPGGLDFKEKAYFLLKGKMPPSVKERWFASNSDYVPQKSDQVVSVHTYNGNLGEPTELPCEIGTKDHVMPLDNNIQDILGSDEFSLAGDLDGDGELSKAELLARFLGQY